MAAYRETNDDLVLVGMDVEPVADDSPLDLGPPEIVIEYNPLFPLTPPEWPQS